MVKRGVCFASVAFVCAIVFACGGEVATRYTGAHVGQPCIPMAENELCGGFDLGEVVAELPSPDADPGVIVCLANHFRGRVTCPYGQNQDGTELPTVDGASGGPFPAGVGPCKTPSGQQVVGSPANPEIGALVEPQCVDRRAAKTVTWSCRCAHADGTWGATDCACPSGTECVQLIAPLGSIGGDVSGAYCVPTGSAYDPMSACAEPCDPSVPANQCP